jgi:hypothetical protein
MSRLFQRRSMSLVSLCNIESKFVVPFRCTASGKELLLLLRNGCPRVPVRFQALLRGSSLIRMVCIILIPKFEQP